MYRNSAEDSAQKKDPPKRFTSGQAAVKVLCVLAAFILWIYVMLVESPEYEQTFSHVVVDLVNTEALGESNLAIYSGYGTRVDVTLSGKKSVVSKLTEKDIVATADLSAASSGGGGRYTCKVYVDVPAGCQLVGMSQESISVYLDSAEQISVDLTERRENTKLPHGCFTGPIDFPVDKVTVTGPSKYLERIVKAVALIDLSGVTETTTLTAKISLVDAFGARIENQYIQFYPDEVTVDIPVLKSAVVPVDVIFRHGFLNSSNTAVTVAPMTVLATGDAAVISRENLLRPLEIDEKTAFDNGVCEFSAYLEAADGVELDTEIVEVYARMDDSIKTRQITVPGENIEDTGGKIGVSYIWEKTPVTVTIMGTLEDITQIHAEDITLRLDMSPYDRSNTGTIKVRAAVVIDSPVKDRVLEAGYYDIQVTFLND